MLKLATTCLLVAALATPWAALPAAAIPCDGISSLSSSSLHETLTSSILVVENGTVSSNAVEMETVRYDSHETLPSSNFKQELLVLVNAERAKLNLPPVCLNSKLSLAAQRHASDMASKNYFSHTGLTGSTFTQRITAAGFKWQSAGEIIAAGQTSATSVMAAWMNSSGHKAIILGAGYRMLGGGYAFSTTSTYKHYWVQEFASSTVETCS